MSSLPWVQFYPSDWLAGTRGMTASETGIYITLIATMYERCEPLTEDVGRLSRLCGASPSAFKNALNLLIEDGKIERVNGGLWNNRVGREVSKRREKSEVARQSAETRWSCPEEKTQQNQSPKNADALPTQSERNANQKPETRDQNKKEEPSVLCPKQASYSEGFERFWNDWQGRPARWPTHAKKTAFAAWNRLDEGDRDGACRAIAAYQADCKAKNHDPKHAERYLRDRVFENYGSDQTGSLQAIIASYRENAH